MPDLGLVLEVEQIGEGLLLGEHGKRERRDELGAAFGDDGAHGRAPLLQAAHELEALIGGDAAADDQEDALAVHVLTVVMPGFMPGIHVLDHIKIVDGRDKPGHDYHLGLTIDTQKSSASAMAASAMAPIQMPMRLARLSRACASASRSTV